MTAALELLRQTDVVPVVLEATEEIGGISRTIRYKGNRMDIGGHRFFSKSDRVMQWWMDLLPPEVAESGTPTVEIGYQGKRRVVAVPARLPQEPVLRGAGPIAIETETEETEADGEERRAGHGHTETVVVAAERAAPADPDLVMLIRPRKSRIYYLRQFFDYPIRLTGQTLRALGLRRTMRVGVSYLWSRVRKIEPERSLEDFLINRFGRELYLTFFKSYTEKVWGTPCDKISAEWGAQRIKGLSLTTAVKHFVKKTLAGRRTGRTAALGDGTRAKVAVGSGSGDVAQKGTDTSLIERFLYPKFGPGQLWEHVAEQVRQMGGEIHLQTKVVALNARPGDAGTDTPRQIEGVETVNAAGERQCFAGDFYFSTMPMRELVQAIASTGYGRAVQCA